MSSGAFVRSRYEADDGTVFGCKVQPETLAATIGGSANAAAAGTVDGVGSARAGGGNREYGVKMRSVSVSFAAGAEPEGYKAGTILRIPVMTAARYNGAAIGSSVTYLGATGTVVGKSPERVR